MVCGLPAPRVPALLLWPFMLLMLVAPRSSGGAWIRATWNGCGRVRVALGGIPTLEVGREFAEQARAAGFEITLEGAQ